LLSPNNLQVILSYRKAPRVGLTQSASYLARTKLTEAFAVNHGHDSGG
jgi:hypothetical protein